MTGLAQFSSPSLQGGEANHRAAQRKNGLLRCARNGGGLTSATSSSVMAGLVPAIHVLRHLGMDLFETIAM
jgi:hypothetical protein